MINNNFGPSDSRRTRLPTSRTAPRQERGVLAVLRGLAPRRRLTAQETKVVAELQANRLLELAGLPQAPTPNEIITELPRIVVRLDPDLPVSGAAHWASGRWQLTINASEPMTRQRFSLCHEAKHVLDHPFVETLYADERQVEAAADYFAACLLMPKREVLRAWTAGNQRLSTLAAAFVVSTPAMARRLETLALRPRVGAVGRPADRKRTPGHYTRQRTAQGASS